MRYIFLKYKKTPLDLNDTGKIIGVLVQDGKRVNFKYSPNLSRLKDYDPDVDELVVDSLGGTIHSMIREKYVYVSSPQKAGAQTSPSDLEFLEDLRKSYQGKVQFSKVHQANYSDLNEGLKQLFKQYVTL